MLIRDVTNHTLARNNLLSTPLDLAHRRATFPDTAHAATEVDARVPALESRENSGSSEQEEVEEEEGSRGSGLATPGGSVGGAVGDEVGGGVCLVTAAPCAKVGGGRDGAAEVEEGVEDVETDHDQGMSDAFFDGRGDEVE